MNIRFPIETALFNVREIRAIETQARLRLPHQSLMKAAGLEASIAIKNITNLGNCGAILILAGPGNNGGDACEVAYNLSQQNIKVTLLLLADEEKYSDEAKACLQRARQAGAEIVGTEILQHSHDNWILIVDGLFGIGLDREIHGHLGETIRYVNKLSSEHNIPILALDVPSGLNADTGQAVGNAETTICASHTITFIGNKPGLHTASGRDFAGNVIVADLGIASELFPAPTMYLNDVSIFEQHLAPRKFNSHKGSYGEVLIIGGSKGMAGAAMLAARAALHAGAGRTTIGFVENSPLYDSNYPEIMCRLASELTPRNEVVVIGPGLGQSEEATQLLFQMLNSDFSLVLDADALNLIAINPVLRSSLQTRKAQSILTPHPLEAGRLLGVSSETIQSDRVRAAKQLADCFQCVAVLKGSGSIISTPQQPLFINTTGNAALATGGTGDVLAGVCGALLAQGMNSLNAARVAVWAHGKSADELVSRGLGPNGLTAGEIIPQIRSVLNHLIKNRHSNQLEC